MDFVVCEMDVVLNEVDCSSSLDVEEVDDSLLEIEIEDGFASLVDIDSVRDWVVPSVGVSIAVAFGGRRAGAWRFTISCLKFSTAHCHDQSKRIELTPYHSARD